MLRVELIYDLDCPNVADARRALLRAFAEADLTPAWTEWDRKSSDSPPFVSGYGSPTILVEGRDVAESGVEAGADCCRLYDHGAGALKGVPPVSRITAALKNSAAPVQASRQVTTRGAWRFMTSIPGVGVGLLPAGICPACWPAYAGVFGSLGLGAFYDWKYLFPVFVVFLGLALTSLAFRARSRRGYGPLGLGLVSVSVILVFKFAYVFDPLAYAGLLGLVAASVWNAWPTRTGATGSCSQCAQAEPATAEPKSAL